MTKVYTSPFFVYSLLSLILLVSFFLGARMILSGDFFFLYDQARDFQLVKDIVLNKDIILIGSRSGIGGFFHGPFYQYLLVPLFIAAKGNPLAFTYLFTLIPPLTVLAGFFVMKKLYDTRVALLTAFFLSITPRIWGYVHSVQGLNLIPLIYIFLLYFLVLYSRGRKEAFIAVAFLAGFTFQFETSSAFMLLPVLTLYFIIFGGIKRIKDLKLIALSLISFCISMSTFILFELKNHFLMLRSLVNALHQPPQNGYLALPERFQEHVGSLSAVYHSGFIENNIILTLLLVAMLVVLCYLILKKQVAPDRLKELFLFISMPMLLYVFFMSYAYPVYAEYVFGLTIPVLFFITLTAVSIWQNRIGKFVVSTFIIVSLFCTGMVLWKQYSVPYKQELSAGSYQNQKAVVDWVFQDAKGKEFGYFVYTPEIFTNGMDYLFWYVGSTHHSFTPTSQKLPVTYLILYPPLTNDAGAHAFWKKNKLHTNSPVLMRKTFPGNIVVEKVSVQPQEEPVDPTYYQNNIFR